MGVKSRPSFPRGGILQVVAHPERAFFFEDTRVPTVVPSPAMPTQAELVPRPLNVTDALSYLDAVKVQFQDKPDVYNHFLDIMKDFKSEV